METKDQQELNEISLESIGEIIKQEQAGAEGLNTALDDDMLTIDIEEPGSKNILTRISEGQYLPELCELCIDNLDAMNDEVTSLLSRQQNKLDGLYINYKVSKTYKMTKVEIGPYFESILNWIQHVRDRIRLRCFKMTLAQMVQIVKQAKNWSKIYTLCVLLRYLQI